jgi:hypothetical protein
MPLQDMAKCREIENKGDFNRREIMPLQDMAKCREIENKGDFNRMDSTLIQESPWKLLCEGLNLRMCSTTHLGGCVLGVAALNLHFHVQTEMGLLL